MEDAVKTFLDNSPIAKKVKLKCEIILQKTRLSANDILEIKRSGVYDSISEKEKICELKIGGVVLAHGKIVKKSGEFYFKTLKSYID